MTCYLYTHTHKETFTFENVLKYSIERSYNDYAFRKPQRTRNAAISNFFLEAERLKRSRVKRARRKKREKRESSRRIFARRLKQRPLWKLPFARWDCNETTTILDYPRKEDHGDPYAQYVQPGNVTATPPSGWDRSFFWHWHMVPRPIGERAKGTDVGQGHKEQRERVRSWEKSERQPVYIERKRENMWWRHPIDKQINRGWKDDPQSYRSIWLQLSFSVSPHVHLRKPRAFAGRGKLALPFSNLSSARKKPAEVIYIRRERQKKGRRERERELLYSEERILLCLKRILFLEIMWWCILYV